MPRPREEGRNCKLTIALSVHLQWKPACPQRAGFVGGIMEETEQIHCIHLKSTDSQLALCRPVMKSTQRLFTLISQLFARKLKIIPSHSSTAALSIELNGPRGRPLSARLFIPRWLQMTQLSSIHILLASIAPRTNLSFVGGAI